MCDHIRFSKAQSCGDLSFPPFNIPPITISASCTFVCFGRVSSRSRAQECTTGCIQKASSAAFRFARENEKSSARESVHHSSPSFKSDGRNQDLKDLFYLLPPNQTAIYSPGQKAHPVYLHLPKTHTAIEAPGLDVKARQKKFPTS